MSDPAEFTSQSARSRKGRYEIAVYQVRQLLSRYKLGYRTKALGH